MRSKWRRSRLRPPSSTTTRSRSTIAAPADPAIADSTEQIFSAARDRFKAGDYEGALDLADQVLKQTPNVAVVHEFRALALFALKRYDDDWSSTAEIGTESTGGAADGGNGQANRADHRSRG
jgi:hypothetical protein